MSLPDVTSFPQVFQSSSPRGFFSAAPGLGSRQFMMDALIPGTKRPVAIIAPKSLHHVYKEKIAQLKEADPSLIIRLVSPRSIHYLKDGDYELVLHEVHEYGRITKQMLERLFSISDRYCARLHNRHAMLVSPTMSPVPTGPTLYSLTVKRFNITDLGHVTFQEGRPQ